jgi:ATP-dependent Clp protease ATP-binding subunit ClpC
MLAVLGGNNFVVDILESMHYDVLNLCDKIEAYIRLKVKSPKYVTKFPKLGKETEILFNIAEMESDKLGDDSINEEHVVLSILKNKELDCTKVLNHQELNYKEFKEKIKENKKRINMSFASDYNEIGDGKDKKSSKKSETPILDNFGRDITEIASRGGIDPIIGRDEEVERVAQILSRRKKNNPILIGEPGCVLGDTKIVVKKISDLSIHTFIDK